jgi:hypothetical protein
MWKVGKKIPKNFLKDAKTILVYMTTFVPASILTHPACHLPRA